jgi:hypothetical protein
MRRSPPKTLRLLPALQMIKSFIPARLFTPSTLQAPCMLPGRPQSHLQTETTDHPRRLNFPDLIQDRLNLKFRISAKLAYRRISNRRAEFRSSFTTSNYIFVHCVTAREKNPFTKSSIMVTDYSNSFPPRSLPCVKLPIQPRHETRFIRLEQQQQALRDARESMIGARLRLRRQRAKLRTSGERSASCAPTVFALLRLALGFSELAYEQAKELYNCLEWAYTRESFMQELHDDRVDDLKKYEPLCTRHDHSAVADGERPLQVEFNGMARSTEVAKHLIAQMDDFHNISYAIGSRTWRQLNFNKSTETDTRLSEYCGEFCANQSNPKPNHPYREMNVWSKGCTAAWRAGAGRSKSWKRPSLKK